MTDNKINFNKFFSSIDNLLIEEKEQKLKTKLSREIKNSIFTDEIVTKLNENDFSGLFDEEENAAEVFSSIFPIVIKNDKAIFRLYKHKVEIDFSNDMCDRYIYMFSDGRLTSGLFHCFNLSDDEYLDKIKIIIDAIPQFKIAILNMLVNFRKNIALHHKKIDNSKGREPLAEKNYNELISYLSKKLK